MKIGEVRMLLHEMEESGVSGDEKMEVFLQYAGDPYYNDDWEVFESFAPVAYNASTMWPGLYDIAAKLGENEVSAIMDGENLYSIVLRAD